MPLLPKEIERKIRSIRKSFLLLRRPPSRARKGEAYLIQFIAKKIREISKFEEDYLGIFDSDRLLQNARVSENSDLQKEEFWV